MDTTIDITAILVFVVAILPITGIFLAVTPYLMRKGEVFAVTVPTVSIRDPYLTKLKHRYTLFVVILTIIVTLVSTLFLLQKNEMGVLISMIAGVFFIFLGAYALMLYYRKKVGIYKIAQNWQAEHQESTAVLNEMNVPEPLSLKWNLLYIPILIVTAIAGYLGYDAMPAQIPMQVGIGGEITNWAEKTPWIIGLPVLIEAFFAACFCVAHWAIIRSKRYSDPSSPASSKYAYGMFARAQSIYLLVGGLIMTAAMIAMPFNFMGIISFMQSITLVLGAALILIVAAIVVSVVYGQGGARVFRRMQESDTLLADDDRYWKLGIFYYNPEDPSWFLPARFGIGWTCNFARPIVWVFTAGIIAVSIAFMVVIMAIA